MGIKLWSVPVDHPALLATIATRGAAGRPAARGACVARESRAWMALPALTDAELREVLSEFDRSGFIVLPLLSQSEVRSLCEAFQVDR